MSSIAPTIEEFVEKHKACINALDDSKTCETCKHRDLYGNDDPCNSCYHIVMGLPVDPTNWVAKEKKEVKYV